MPNHTFDFVIKWNFGFKFNTMATKTPGTQSSTKKFMKNKISI
jgi:hypothetical protein